MSAPAASPFGLATCIARFVRFATSIALRTVVLFFALPVSSALAAPVVFECRAQQRNYPSELWSPFKNLIQPDMRFIVDGSSVTLDDALVRSVNGGPMQVELSENTDKKFVARWQLVASGFGGRQATMSFRAAFFLKQKSELIVTQVVMGSTTTFHARGDCILLPGERS